MYQFAYNRLFCTYLHIRSASKEGMLSSCHIPECFLRDSYRPLTSEAYLGVIIVIGHIVVFIHSHRFPM